MLFPSKKFSDRLAQNLWAMALAAISSVLAFLFAQLVAKNPLMGLPLLLPVILFAFINRNGTLWSVITAACTLFVFSALDMVFNPIHRTIPVELLLVFSIFYLGTVAASGWFSAIARRQQHYYKEQSTLDALISEINTHLLTAATKEELYQLTLRHLYRLTTRSASLYVCNDAGQLSHIASYPPGLILYPTEKDAAYEAFRLGIRTGFGTPYFDHSSFCYLPLLTSNETVGVVGILTNPQSPMNPRLISTIQLMLVRVAVALEKQKLSEQHQNALMDKELEQMRSDFLRAISHDFRTPLTGIISACSALIQEEVVLGEPVRQQLIQSIEQEAQWLMRMVENLLSVTRTEMRGVKLDRSLEPVEEVLSTTLEKAVGRFPNIALKLSQPAEFIMIPMNPMLIVQVLMNLIENAVKYAPGSDHIDLIVTADEKDVYLTVRDYGSGFTAEDPNQLFVPSVRKAGDSKLGMGQGLSICRSVIRAHGGDITAKNCPDGGSAFTFSLPREEQP